MPRFQTFHNYELYYETSGPDVAKNTLMLIMGFGCDFNYWDDFPANIVDVDPGTYRVIMSDTRGFGRSTGSITNLASTSSMAEDYYDLLVSLNYFDETVNSPLDGPHLHIVGWFCRFLTRRQLIHPDFISGL